MTLLPIHQGHAYVCGPRDWHHFLARACKPEVKGKVMLKFNWQQTDIYLSCFTAISAFLETKQIYQRSIVADF